ncbi:hypothetical protein GCM10009844_23770 [Nocardioides koreensis]|uniref:GmrSD restriction endonucleases N-terminal domain-containing protein n=1 Tax=Nocardioides koreensis TaxID=433651 RepID=A0ABN2ZSZ2_9ACTN
MPGTQVQNKAQIVARMYELAGEEPQPLGPGSKERKSALEALGRSVGLDLTSTPGKHECGRRIAARVDVAWDGACYSTGDTITLEGLRRLLLGAEAALGSEDVDDGIGRAVKPSSDQERDGSVDDQERSDLESAVAENLAALTQPGEAPEGVTPAPDEVPVAAIDFADGNWLSHLVSVQGWLRLPHDLAVDDADSLLVSLAEALDVPEATAQAVLPRLSDRLERAVALRDAFWERLEAAAEGDATLSTASRQWVADWDEVDDEVVAERGGPIHAEADTWPITQFVQYANYDELELSPSYQRAEVWPNSDSQMLIESVLRGIPLPSVILLQRSGASGTAYEVVDGKQRLTAILRFMGRHPRGVAEVRRRAEVWGESPDDVLRLFQDDYPAFKRLWKQREQSTLTAKLEKDLHFPYPLRSGNVPALSGGLEALRGKYYCQAREYSVDVLGDKRRVRSIFEEQSKYKVPVITYTQVTSEQIHEVFSLYNRQGKHLNAEEIRNALFHHLALMRGLLVTAGDSADVDVVAPFLRPAWSDLSSTSRTLDRYGFRDAAGYKRTKILSWVGSILVHGDGRLESRSTATHINGLLERLGDNRNDSLRSEAKVRELMLLLDHGLDAHALVPNEVWTDRFVNAQSRGKWQELQLVASLTGLAAAYEFHGEALLDLVEERFDDIRAMAATREWQRPDKTQSREQWQYVADVIGGVLSIFEVPDKEVEHSLLEKFGGTGLTSLRALRGQRMAER